MHVTLHDVWGDTLCELVPSGSTCLGVLRVGASWGYVPSGSARPPTGGVTMFVVNPQRTGLIQGITA